MVVDENDNGNKYWLNVCYVLGIGFSFVCVLCYEFLVILLYSYCFNFYFIDEIVMVWNS